MHELKFERIKQEIYWRLLASFNNHSIEQELNERCIRAIENRNLKNLCAPITIVKKNNNGSTIKYFASEHNISQILSETGVMDIVCMCINAQA